jgi:hypothetical protein
MSSTELLPCPFCGGEADLCVDSAHSTAYWIGCSTIGCFGNKQWEETEVEAIRAWNRRRLVHTPIGILSPWNRPITKGSFIAPFMLIVFALPSWCYVLYTIFK